jgi:hypothetical protein
LDVGDAEPIRDRDNHCAVRSGGFGTRKETLDLVSSALETDLRVCDLRVIHHLSRVISRFRGRLLTERILAYDRSSDGCGGNFADKATARMIKLFLGIAFHASSENRFVVPPLGGSV